MRKIISVLFLIVIPIFAYSQNTAETGQFIPVNQQIFSMIEHFSNSDNTDYIGLIGRIRFALSDSFSVAISNNNQQNIIITTDGGIRLSEQQILRFTKEQEGELRTFRPEFPEPFVILFAHENEKIPLIFRKNPRLDSYELFAIEYGHRMYMIQSGERPQLLVFSTLGNENLLRAILASAPRAVTSVGSHHPSSPSRINTSVVSTGGTISTGVTSGSPRPAVIGNNNIIGSGTTTEASVIAYIMSRPNRPVVSNGIVMARPQPPVIARSEIERIVRVYFREAAIEGVNPDIAIAQMLYATDFFTNNTVIQSRNYAGLSPVANFNGTFPGDRGITSHIQHLWGYANPASSSLRGQLINPRMRVLNDLGYRGRATTFDQLYQYWTLNSYDYGNAINRIITDMRRF